MQEIWKDIRGYEGLYQVSNMGRIKSLRNNKGEKRELIKKLHECKNGYLDICLHKDAFRKNFLEMIEYIFFLHDSQKLASYNRTK